jgi:hypothetical protein
MKQFVTHHMTRSHLMVFVNNFFLFLIFTLYGDEKQMNRYDCLNKQVATTLFEHCVFLFIKIANES